MSDIEPRPEPIRGELVVGVPPPPWDGIFRAPRGAIRFAIPESIRRRQEAIDAREVERPDAVYLAGEEPLAARVARFTRVAGELESTITRALAPAVSRAAAAMIDLAASAARAQEQANASVRHDPPRGRGPHPLEPGPRPRDR